MDASLPILITVFTGGCMLVAAWPLLWLARLRPVVAGASGSTLIASGIAGFALVLSGCVARAEPAASRVAASESAPSSAAGSGSGAEEAQPPADDSPDSGSTSDQADDPIIEATADTPIIPPGRPAWVESKPVTSGEVHKLAVSSGPYAREIDARRALEREIAAATSRYIAEHVDSDLAPKFLRYDAATIRRGYVRDEYQEVITVSVGDMHQIHALLQFGPDFRQEIERRWAGVTATSRLGQVGLFAGAALLLLGSVFSYFRLDNATRGYYTGRLQFMAAAAILTIVGAGALLARWITWL
jgi:hypothetical protein